jgi:rhodanese-related sulfurtransferase
MAIFPTQNLLQPDSKVHDLKARLDWGEPALTIVDVRDRDAFNEARITGAISFPLAELVERATQTLEKIRDIYVYGDTDEMTASAASYLQDAGFQHVAKLQGGLAAWQAAKFPVETSM